MVKHSPKRKKYNNKDVSSSFQKSISDEEHKENISNQTLYRTNKHPFGTNYVLQNKKY